MRSRTPLEFTYMPENKSILQLQSICPILISLICWGELVGPHKTLEVYSHLKPFPYSYRTVNTPQLFGP